jgi:hypothetical protein
MALAHRLMFLQILVCCASNSNLRGVVIGNEFDEMADFKQARQELTSQESVSPTAMPTNKLGVLGADDDTSKRVEAETARWEKKMKILHPGLLTALPTSVPTKAPTLRPSRSASLRFNKDQASLMRDMEAFKNGAPTPSPKQMLKDLRDMAHANPTAVDTLIHATPRPTASPTYSFQTLSKCAVKQAQANKPDKTELAAPFDPGCPVRALCLLHKDLPSCKISKAEGDRIEKLTAVLARAFQRQRMVTKRYSISYLPDEADITPHMYNMVRQEDGVMLGGAPWIKPSTADFKNPRNVQPSVAACKAQCMSHAQCSFSTFITAGVRRGECWLARKARMRSPRIDARERRVAAPCGVPCESFAKMKVFT